jgi:SET domain-containing protein 6
MADFNEASRNFLAWLQSANADISSKIELQDLRSKQAGRGVGKSSVPE